MRPAYWNRGRERLYCPGWESAPYGRRTACSGAAVTLCVDGGSDLQWLYRAPCRASKEDLRRIVAVSAAPPQKRWQSTPRTVPALQALHGGGSNEALAAPSCLCMFHLAHTLVSGADETWRGSLAA